MGNPRYANGNARRGIRKRWKQIGAPCALCGQPIDYSLGMVRDPASGKVRPHPMSFVVDEIVPVSRGGSPTSMDNTQPAHWICNARKGDGRRGRKGAANAELPLPLPWDL